MISWRRELREAAIDYRYLLDRGYSGKPSLDIVVSRYGLSREERLFLLRCVHSKKDVESIGNKFGLEEPLIVDGYNIGLTLLNALEGDPIYLCDDGFVRDLSLGKRKNDVRILTILNLLAEYLISFRLDYWIVLDSQISRSGEIGSRLRENNINVKVVNKADKEIITFSGTAASNDFVILTKAKKVFDVMGIFLLKEVEPIRFPFDLYF
ncbi:DUF434 domain-containing protein [Metallosphaera tengchongensis]|uniref:DUF434 domain-containing protein n=1 Tax=Metallosphaera tengchongensis TaxID=1532350 RepID=A0A6N0NUV7_9CREN|nr:DUF434 domain-containing protein [Metallosphaera tengchongensis]QKQ99267.1 DUF434 domain-containing protein [Metallosphaera tengchongensis]